MSVVRHEATVTDLTGMNTVAACFLIPIGVSIYVMTGGMRATLHSDRDEETRRDSVHTREVCDRG
jgi:Na+/proline symporter